MKNSTYSEFAVKKYGLLVNAFPKMSEQDRIVLVIIGLPFSVNEKLNRVMIDTQGKLQSKLNRLAIGSKGNKYKNNTLKYGLIIVLSVFLIIILGIRIINLVQYLKNWDIKIDLIW